MKELSIEEKAKRYDKLFVKASRIYNKENDVLILHTIEDLIPELKESEDERIRKELIEFVKSRGGFKQEYIAWLEKQGEQSSLNINRECLKGIKRVQEYQDLSDWEKEFDKIASMYAHNKNQEGYNDSWYVKERAAEMLYYAKKELEKQGEQNLNWGEEDECYMRECIGAIATKDGWSFEEKRKTKHWLKALKDRYTWKPSDEQMEALFVLLPTVSYGRNPAFSLYNDLKKLRGE